MHSSPAWTGTYFNQNIKTKALWERKNYIDVIKKCKNDGHGNAIIYFKTMLFMHSTPCMVLNLSHKLRLHVPLRFHESHFSSPVISNISFLVTTTSPNLAQHMLYFLLYYAQSVSWMFTNHEKGLFQMGNNLMEKWGHNFFGEIWVWYSKNCRSPGQKSTRIGTEYRMLFLDIFVTNSSSAPFLGDR